MFRNEFPVLCVCTKVTFGVRSTKSCGVWMPVDRISDSVNALTDTGLSASVSDRILAVTTTSSKVACETASVAAKVATTAAMTR